MALTREALAALVGDAGALEADEREHAAQEDVDFMEVREMTEHARTHEAVVRVIVDDLGAHEVQKFVEALRRRALEPRIRRTARPHAVDDFGTTLICIDHALHRRDVILPVAIDGNRDVRLFLCFHKAGEDSILMAAVPTLRDADKMRVFHCELFYDFPCPVAAAIVDEEDAAVSGNLSLPKQQLQFVEEHVARDGKHLLLVVAGDDDEEAWCLRFHISLPSPFNSHSFVSSHHCS